jgi:CheY-like chemotaxis protein
MMYKSWNKPMKKNILIVGDNIEDRFFLGTVLTGSGFAVVSTANGAEVVEEL